MQPLLDKVLVLFCCVMMMMPASCVAEDPARPSEFAHRGNFECDCEENTQCAFDCVFRHIKETPAEDRQADGLETDFRACDGRLVISHDALTHCPEDGGADAFIASFRDVLKTAPDATCAVEVKRRGSARDADDNLIEDDERTTTRLLLDALLLPVSLDGAESPDGESAVADFLVNHVILISFEETVFDEAAKWLLTHPEVNLRRGALMMSGFGVGVEAAFRTDIDIAIDSVSFSSLVTVNELREQGKKIGFYGVDSDEALNQVLMLMRWGWVDLIISDALPDLVDPALDAL